MELRHLRYFIVAAEEENFNRAAERLHLAQPALSRRIHDLEAEMGVLLFERGKQRVRLSTVGRAFFDDIRRVLKDLERACAKSRRMSRGETGVLSLGLNHTVLRHAIASRAVQEFHAKYPDVEVKMDAGKHRYLVDAILDGQVDAAFLYTRPIDDPVFDYVEVVRDAFLLALPKLHPLASRPEIRLADLREEDFLWMKRENAPSRWDQMIAACEAGGLTPRIVQQVTSESSRLHLVAAGMGVTFVTTGFQNYLSESVAIRRVVDFNVTMTLELAWRRDNLSPLLEGFIEIVKQLKALLGPPGAS